MKGLGLSGTRSAIRGLTRASLRTTEDGRPPRHDWDHSQPRPSLWQLTTRPPRGRSGSQLPVEVGVSVCVWAGRMAVGVRQSQVMDLQ